MKILVISNFYPPHYIGGYELGCQEAVEGLRDQGHQVKVLTSTYGIDRPTFDNNTYRWLKIESVNKIDGVTGFKQLFAKEARNQFALKILIFQFRPDIIYIWNLAQVSISLVLLAQQKNLPVYYFIFDSWLSQLQPDYWFLMWERNSQKLSNKLGKGLIYFLIKKIGLVTECTNFQVGKNVQFASQYLKHRSLQIGHQVEEAPVIHWGINLKKYSYKKDYHKPQKLLYVGQIIEHKGVHTVIEALSLIVKQTKYSSITLTIIGGTTVPTYETYIHDLVSSLNLQDKVDFKGFFSRQDLISIYQEHDILIFPSIWEEPFGITLLEGMASGLPIVSTANGGSKEILQDEFNALVFTKEDYHQCAKQIMRLIDDSDLFKRIRNQARIDVEKKYNFDNTLKQIQNSLYTYKKL